MDRETLVLRQDLLDKMMSELEYSLRAMAEMSPAWRHAGQLRMAGTGWGTMLIRCSYTILMFHIGKKL